MDYTLIKNKGSHEICASDLSAFNIENFDADENTTVFNTKTSLPVRFFESISKKLGVDFDVLYQDRKNHTEGIFVIKKGVVVYANNIPNTTNPAYIKDMLTIETYYALLERLEEDARNITVEEIYKLAEKGEWDKIFSAVYPF